ncbi:hypothetical protein BKA62DRAFT_84959 [Auriculariales sp. MPI-PUGE-AT-0066]|nr:hypothetical protein BKA62DRAFT_84959 [Auriculariales sp. MPI-PUGE-AT-0066]
MSINIPAISRNNLPDVFRLSEEYRRSIRAVDAYCDPVDEDNPEMCALALWAFPNAHVNIVFSPRPVDLQAPLYGDAFGHLKDDILKIKRPDQLILPLGMQKDRSWLEKIPAKYKHLFFEDKGFEEQRIRDVTPKYLVSSSYRFSEKFTLLEHEFSRFTFYWDPQSMDTIRVGIRHPVHVNDFAYAFKNKNDNGPRDDDNELARFNVAKDLEGPEREQAIMTIMDHFIKRQFQKFGEFGLAEETAILHHFDELVEERQRTKVIPFVMVGGPFETILKYIDSDLKVLQIWCQSLYTSGHLNLFANQYNNHCNMGAAIQFFERVKQKKIPTLVTPTEATKGSKFEFDDEQLSEAFKYAPFFYKDTLFFRNETKTLVRSIAFDVIAVIGTLHPDILPAKPVHVFATTITTPLEGEVVILKAEHKTEGDTSPEGCIWMYWNDDEWQGKNVPILMELFQTVFRPKSMIGS